MFDSAKDFVIQTGVFIELVDGAKAYAKKLSRTPGSKTRNAYHDYSEYRRIRKGDIKLVDCMEKYWKPDASDDAHDDYIVEVAGENRTRMARFYHGRNPHKRFEMEIDLMSNLSHPRIAQVFGVCYPTDTPGIVLHYDGAHRGFTEFATTLFSPLQRVAFCIKYTEEYFDATSYLYNHVQNHKFLNESKIYCSMFTEEHSLVAECFVDSSSHLTIILSRGSPVVTRAHRKTHARSYANPDSNWNVLDRKMARPSRQDIELIQSTFNMNIVQLRTRSQRIKLISTWHSLLMHSRRVCKGTKQDTVYLGRPVWIGIVQDASQYPSSSSMHYIPRSFDRNESIRRNVFKPNVVWTLVNNLQQPNKLPGGINRFTLSVAYLLLNPPSERRIRITADLCIDCNQICRAWLTQASLIQRDLQFASIPGNHLGIVTDGQINIDIDFNYVTLLYLWTVNPNTQVQLFVSDPEIEYKNGMIKPPSVYWESNFEDNKFGGHIRQILSFEISLHPVISYWNTFVYDAMHELHKTCDLEARDVCNLLGLPTFSHKMRAIRSTRKALSYTENISLHFFSTEYEKEKNDEHGTEVRTHSLSSLSWIGVTILENYGYMRLSSGLLKGCSINIAQENEDEEWVDFTNPSNSLSSLDASASIHDPRKSNDSELGEWEEV